jgi:hypothetical protein
MKMVVINREDSEDFMNITVRKQAAITVSP